MLSLRPFARRGSSRAALILLSLLASCAARTAPPPTKPADVPEPTTRSSGPTSLDALRLDRRMTLLNAGETLRPTAKLPDDASEYLVELGSHKELILDLARRGGRPLPTVRLLPEESRTPDRYGIVTADHAILRAGPRDVRGDRENQSDATLGEPVWILDASEDKESLLVHASDGYLGWVDAKAIWPVDVQLFRTWSAAYSRRWITDQFVTFSDLLACLDRRNPKTANDHATRALDRGERGGRFRRREVAIEKARALMGAPYLWGGKTRGDGIDCSGLTQAALAYAGVLLPRDADQQSLVGRLVATRWDASALLAGDLLFYVSPRRGNVHHVAIYLGGGEYIEAAGPDVHVSSMTPGAANYDGKRAATFGWARRVIE